MNGVEILSSVEVVCEFVFNWTSFWIALGAMVCFAIIMGIITVIKGEISWWFILICLIIGLVGGSLLGLVIGGEVNATPTAYETHYKVTIDDSVSFNEFLDKYEILGQDGKIYTVRERE